MQIQTAFAINELTQQKFTGVQSLLFFEVIEINTVTCSAGTQNYYICRVQHPDYDSMFSAKKKLIGFNPGSKGDREYFKFREDELIPASQAVHDAIAKLKEPPTEEAKS